ncbi:hypothetical protein [Candidatus Protochlamydia phocaeensis]|uniref:hypothetical protein n=1 Tax=Candidatus Protochlamydia phocaeensis TaxID=1414722 RepID=UPI000838ADC8|nr:hypothetical protein [Candidatus Protochlamydia phocaeensis]
MNITTPPTPIHSSPSPLDMLTINDRLAKCIEKEELNHDPLYTVIMLGTVFLIAQTYKAEDKAYYLEKGWWVKIGFRADGTIIVNKPHMTQWAWRWIEGHSQEDLQGLRKHLVSALRWFLPHTQSSPKSEEALRTIFEYCVLGLKELKQTYGPRTCDCKTLELPPLSQTNKSENFLRIEEDNFTSRGIEQDILFIEEVLRAPKMASREEPSKEEKQTAPQLVLQEESRLFQLRHFPIPNSSKEASEIETIEMVYAKKVRALWSEETLVAIANLFKTQVTLPSLVADKQIKAVNSLKAIEAAVAENPVAFMQIKASMYNLTFNTFSKTTHKHGSIPRRQ